MTTYTDSQAKAIKNYLKDKERVAVWVTKEKKDEIKDAASSAGLNISQFVLQAIDHEIEAAAPGSSAAASDMKG